MSVTACKSYMYYHLHACLHPKYSKTQGLVYMAHDTVHNVTLLSNYPFDVVSLNMQFICRIEHIHRSRCASPFNIVLYAS